MVKRLEFERDENDDCFVETRIAAGPRGNSVNDLTRFTRETFRKLTKDAGRRRRRPRRCRRRCRPRSRPRSRRRHRRRHRCCLSGQNIFQRSFLTSLSGAEGTGASSDD